MSDERWSWKEQRADTEHTFRELKKQAGIKEGAAIDLDLTFLPDEDGADTAALVRALETFGYAAEAMEDGSVEATAEGVRFTLDEVWTHEERTTKLALARGFAPDGWGFWAPE